MTTTIYRKSFDPCVCGCVRYSLKVLGAKKKSTPKFGSFKAKVMKPKRLFTLKKLVFYRAENGRNFIYVQSYISVSDADKFLLIYLQNAGEKGRHLRTSHGRGA